MTLLNVEIEIIVRVGCLTAQKGHMSKKSLLRIKKMVNKFAAILRNTVQTQKFSILYSLLKNKLMSSIILK